MDEVWGRPTAPFGPERRLREIERELAVLRREQRFFRRIGFGENIKAMQAVELQVERRMCIDALPTGSGARQASVRTERVRAILQQVAGSAAVGLALMFVALKSVLSSHTGRAPRRRARPASAMMASDNAMAVELGMYSEVSPVPLYSR